MFKHVRCVQRLNVLFLLVSTWSTLSTCLDLDYCADFNTAETSRNTSIYQTNGLCHDFCVDDYAYAITQKNSCWCSNYGPSKSSQEDVSDCDTPCPAWPSEYCGGDGLYGYVSLDNVLPSGTRGPSATSTSAEAETTAAISRITETVRNTVTFFPTESTTTSDSSSSSFSSSDDQTSTKTGDASTATSTETSTETSVAEEPTTSQIRTVTAGGTIKTVTIGPSQTGTSANENAGVTVEKNGLSTGAVAGIAVGVIAAVIAAAGIGIFLFFRRKKQRSEQEAFQDDPSVRGSSSGMMASGRPDMSMLGSSPGSQNSASNRNSTLHVDPRMDPFKQGLYVRSASHESVNTLRDDHDYSRRIQQPKVLRATNPDPED